MGSSKTRCESMFICLLLIQSVFCFDVDSFCANRCLSGSGGILCKCNAFHFAGKRANSVSVLGGPPESSNGPHRWAGTRQSHQQQDSLRQLQRQNSQASETANQYGSVHSMADYHPTHDLLSDIEREHVNGLQQFEGSQERNGLQKVSRPLGSRLVNANQAVNAPFLRSANIAANIASLNKGPPSSAQDSGSAAYSHYRQSYQQPLEQVINKKATEDKYDNDKNVDRKNKTPFAVRAARWRQMVSSIIGELRAKLHKPFLIQSKGNGNDYQAYGNYERDLPILYTTNKDLGYNENEVNSEAQSVFEHLSNPDLTSPELLAPTIPSEIQDGGGMTSSERRHLAELQHALESTLRKRFLLTRSARSVQSTAAVTSPRKQPLKDKTAT